MAVRVLVVDDELSSRQLCVEVLEGLGYKVEAVDSPVAALSLLEDGEMDIVVSDIRMPGGSGLDLLRTIKENNPDIDVLMMTGYGSIPEAVEAVKLGAYDYITKPFKLEKFRLVIEHMVEHRQLAAENRLLREELKTQDGFGEFVGTSEAMQQVYRIILKVSEKRHPVLVLGESGTGKELVARAIHAYGPMREKPFVPVDCGALTPNLIESELFGHVRGAFTGASQARTGLLASAGGGTVFMDEIGELPIELQAKLLRALQEREVRPIGSNEPVPLRARVVAATNRDLEAAIEKGMFREDLYFRLNVVSILVPPLRERKADIPALVQHLIARHGGPEEGVAGFTPEALDRMMSYGWPGNVRELENCVQRALSLGSGPRLQLRDLPPALLGNLKSKTGLDDPHTLENLERRAILNALQTAGGDRLRAAKLLGIGKTTIYRKLKEYGIEESSPVDTLREP
ncbi:MAG TPA: sigma-54 dependent transcriptional regulator [Terriglobia bacterium]|nr:sigma-54 dependent transcriptional regulator [Terriglobia bacterium]